MSLGHFSKVLKNYCGYTTVYRQITSTVEKREKIVQFVSDTSAKTVEKTAAKMSYANAVQMQNTSVLEERRRGGFE